MSPRHTAAVLAFVTCLVVPPALRAQERPRLVVLCAVDQLAEWLYREARPHFGENGFRRLEREGVRFSECAFAHGCTETGPGHATIGTGLPAAGHGIVRNDWYLRDTGKGLYCVGDPDVKGLPDWPEGRQRGPRWLMAPSLGDAMQQQFGEQCQVVSVSLKDRSAILMGGRKADLAIWYEPTTGRLVTNQQYATAAPDWLVKWNAGGAVDRHFGWTWDRLAGEQAYAGLDDDRRFEPPHLNGDSARTLPQRITGGDEEPGARYYASVYASPVGNTVVRELAVEAIARCALGQDDVPDLLCVSFSSQDVIGHYRGADSVEARDSLLRIDRELGLLLDELDRTAGAGRWLFLLTSDHGVGRTPEAVQQAGGSAGRGLLLIRARAAAEKALADRFGKPPAGRRYVAAATDMALYFDAPALQAVPGDPHEVRREAVRVAATAAGLVTGIMRGYDLEALRARPDGSDAIALAIHHAIFGDRNGDVQLVVQPNWLDGAITGSHGSPHLYDRQVPLLGSGPWLPQGLECRDAVTPGLAVAIACDVLGLPALAGVETVPAAVKRP